MTPEELNRLINQPPPTQEYRLYYDEQGMITMFAEQNHPEGNNYIVLDNSADFYNANTLLLRVKDGKLVKIDPVIKYRQGLFRSTTGQRVVKGMAAMALYPKEEYIEIEYYERKTNN